MILIFIISLGIIGILCMALGGWYSFKEKIGEATIYLVLGLGVLLVVEGERVLQNQEVIINLLEALK